MINYIWLEQQINSLKEQQQEMWEASFAEQERRLNELIKFRKLLRETSNQKLLLEVLTKKGHLDIGLHYSFYEFQEISHNPNISDEVFEELLKYDYLAINLIKNEGLSFDNKCKIIKKYFNN